MPPRLVLDLVALRCGVGLALALLARVEPDVDKNWRPARLSVTAEGEGKQTSSNSDNNSGQLMAVAWRDPLAVLYLAPVPKELRLHYVLEVSFPPGSGLDDLVEVVGHDDARYYRQMWRSAEPGAVSLGEPAAATYRQVFSGYFPDLQQQVSVSAWTLVDGHLIARSTVLYGGAGVGGDCCCSVGFQDPPSSSPAPAKPPRQCGDEEDPDEHGGCDVEIVVQRPSDDEDEDDDAAADDEGRDVERGHNHSHSLRRMRRRTSVPKERAITPAVSSVFEFSQEEDEDDDECHYNNDSKKSDGGSLNGSDRGARSDRNMRSGDRSKSLGNLGEGGNKRRRKRKVKKRMSSRECEEAEEDAGRDNPAFQNEEGEEGVDDKVYLI